MTGIAHLTNKKIEQPFVHIKDVAAANMLVMMQPLAELIGKSLDIPYQIE